MANEQNLKPFTKKDKRINRRGRPKSFDELRRLAQQLAHEATETKQGDMTAVEIILRQMMQDKKQRLQFLEYAFGKVPQNVDVTSGGEKIESVTVIEIVKANDE